MAEMGAMEMPMPDNTLPMMTGFGQFGPIEMGGMFTVMKVREGLGANDYGDPGPYRNPAGQRCLRVQRHTGRTTALLVSHPSKVKLRQIRTDAEE